MFNLVIFGIICINFFYFYFFYSHLILFYLVIIVCVLFVSKQLWVLLLGLFYIELFWGITYIDTQFFSIIYYIIK